ncbi:Crp/Fnr family transcriptional regulator, partial [Methylobacterium radiotolerans]|uniref:Crp/Fnr family transcriptional regulator n=1 Tax=Methylobacterium radiotolerans TaxID=31998 RepID=UPI001FD90238
LDGWACRYKQFPDGRRAIVALLLPGDLCDPFVFRRARMDHAIGALTPVTVARIAPEQIGDAVRGRPAVEECLWRELLAATAIHREWIASVRRRSALERPAHPFFQLPIGLAAGGGRGFTDESWRGVSSCQKKKNKTPNPTQNRQEG